MRHPYFPMTTPFTQSQSPRLPRPNAYRAYLDRVLPDPRPSFIQRLLNALKK